GFYASENRPDGPVIYLVESIPEEPYSGYVIDQSRRYKTFDGDNQETYKMVHCASEIKDPACASCTKVADDGNNSIRDVVVNRTQPLYTDDAACPLMMDRVSLMTETDSFVTASDADSAISDTVTWMGYTGAVMTDTGSYVMDASLSVVDAEVEIEQTGCCASICRLFRKKE
ncbi:hypothetical protein ElyMa_005782500, partial [Elysia marginata]